MLNKNNSSELSDEDILSGVNFANNPSKNGELAQNESQDRSPNDFVDSSLFMAEEFKEENHINIKDKNEQQIPGNSEKEIQNVQQPKRTTDIQRPKIKENKTTVEENIQKEEVPTSINDDIIVIKADEKDIQSNFKWKLAGFILLAIGLGSASYVFWNKSKETKVAVQEQTVAVAKNNEELPQQESVSAESDAERVVEIAELSEADSLKIKINVFNGSGVAGAAGKVKDLLINKKYESVEAKNYPTDKIADSSVYYKEDIFKEEAQKVADFLEIGSNEMPVRLASKDEEKSADVVIVLGK